ncbi:MAG: rhodanese-related sulfurtransferase [Peptococcaceae bacterium]|nr:rhodanese-related sulfurtransferase [Peptococcaceae bacterium]
MFKSNGEKALLGVGLVTVIFLGLVLVLGIGQQAPADSTFLQEAIHQYFERMPDDSYRISPPVLKTLLEGSKDTLYIIDIRDEKDYKVKHIEGAVHIPFKDVGKKLNTLPKDKLIIVYCYTGQNGGQVTALLNLAGFRVKSLSGGWNNGWLPAFGQEKTPEAPASCS